MAKTTRISTITLVALGAAWLGLPACNGENAPSRRAVLPIDTDAGTDFGVAGAPSREWNVAHPLCGVTKDNIPIAKNVPCAPEDTQHCYKTCGPYNLGFKEETCSGAAYAENSVCNFDPHVDYSCFKIPEPEDVDPGCPTDEAFAPRHNQPCTLLPCHVCGGNTNEQTTGYRDATAGALKVGFCVCRPAVVDASGTVTSIQKWACATMGTAWPCPNGFGC
jgi:hypothetical protein